VFISGGDGNPGPADYAGFRGSYGLFAHVFGRAALQSRPYVRYVTYTGFGNGGLGANGCPDSPGGPGGFGASSVTYGVPIVAVGSFNGGNGNDGVGPGGRGLAGSADSPIQMNLGSFMPGVPGSGCPKPPRRATGSLTNGLNGELGYSVQTDPPANAMQLTLPAGNNIHKITVPSAFTAADCTDSGNVETCRNGAVEAGAPLTGSFGHSVGIAANCGCVTVAFSSDNGVTWQPSPPGTLTGPPSNSPPTG
jgi:hypothetical protein